MGIRQRFHSWFGDPVLAIAVFGLTVFGVAMIYSAGQVDVPDAALVRAWKMQLVWLVLSLVALYVVMRIELRWLEWLAPPVYFVAVATLVLTLAVGSGHGTAAGTRSWIGVGSVRVQPSQFANLATILMLGRVLGGWREVPDSLVGLWKPIAVVVVPMGLVFLQPDLGTAMVFGGILIATLYWARTPLTLIFMLLSPMLGLFLAFRGWLFSLYMIGLIGFLYLYRAALWEGVLVVAANLAAGTVALPVWNSLEPYQKARLLVFLDPSIDPRGEGYHVTQSRIAIGSGAWFGKGFTLGTQKRLRFVPEQHTDFIFSVIGEEFGFLGGMLVLAAYALILWRLAKLAERLSEPFAGVVVFGIFGAWFTHIVVNIGMTVGVMPITGIPLPFLSYGGSFLLATYLALGVAERIAGEKGRGF